MQFIFRFELMRIAINQSHLDHLLSLHISLSLSPHCPLLFFSSKFTALQQSCSHPAAMSRLLRLLFGRIRPGPWSRHSLPAARRQLPALLQLFHSLDAKWAGHSTKPYRIHPTPTIQPQYLTLESIWFNQQHGGGIFNNLDYLGYGSTLAPCSPIKMRWFIPQFMGKIWVQTKNIKQITTTLMGLRKHNPFRSETIAFAVSELKMRQNNIRLATIVRNTMLCDRHI